MGEPELSKIAPSIEEVSAPAGYPRTVRAGGFFVTRVAPFNPKYLIGVTDALDFEWDEGDADSLQYSTCHSRPT